MYGFQKHPWCCKEVSLHVNCQGSWFTFFPFVVLGVHRSSTLNEVSWLQYKDTNYQVSPCWKWNSMILLRKGMILEVNILEISTEKGCPWWLVQGVRTHYVSRLLRLCIFVTRVSWPSTLKDTSHFQVLFIIKLQTNGVIMFVSLINGTLIPNWYFKIC